MAKSSVQGKKAGMAPTQMFLPISEIREGHVVLKNGGIRAVLQVSSVNFSLKSEQEQNALIYAYQGFLNTLDFPVQIVMKSKKLDIDSYIEGFEVIAKDQQNPLLKKLTKEYMEYVEKLVEYADIMEKQFFVVVPYDPIRSRDRGMFSIFWDAIHPVDQVGQIRQRHYEFDSLKRGLSPRVDTVKTGLENCGLQVEQLDTPQLVELFYQAYNPQESRNQKVEKVEDETLVNV